VTRLVGSLTRHGWFVAIVVAYLWGFPYFPRIHSANELPRVYLTKAIADDHTFAIERGIARWTFEEGGGATADVSPSGGHQYSNKAPGSSMLAVPAYWVAKLVAGEPGLAATMWICRVAAGVVPMLLFLLLLYRFLARYAPEPAIRQLVCLAYGLGSLAMTYSVLYFSHQLGAVCVASAWILGLEAADRDRAWSRLWRIGAAGALAGASALVDYQAVFAAVPAAVHVIVRLRRRPPRDLVAAIAVALGCALIPIAILLAYHWVCFGSPWRTGYDASVTFAANHQQGFLGLTKLRWDAFVGSLFKFDNGLFVLSPWLLIALPGLVVLARGGGDPVERAALRRGAIELALGLSLIAIGIAIYVAGVVDLHGRLLHPLIDGPIALGLIPLGLGAARLCRGPERATAAVGVSVLVIYVLFVSGLNFWRGGWGVGPRYITAMLPFLLPAVAAAITALSRRDRRWVGVVAGTMVVGIAIYTLSSITFPYWPETMKHPFFDLTLRLLGHGLVAPNLASAAGIDGVIGFVPVLALVIGVVGHAIWRAAGTRGLGIAVGVALGVFALYAAKPHGDPRARRDFVAVRASFEPLAADVLEICEARDRGRASTVSAYQAYLKRIVVTERAARPVDEFARGELDVASFADRVHVLMDEVDLDRCPTLDWARSVSPVIPK